MNIFDLIVVQGLAQNLRNGVDTVEGFRILDQIKEICDCQLPDGTSTWELSFFRKELGLGPGCRFCGRSEYDTM